MPSLPEKKETQKNYDICSRLKGDVKKLPREQLEKSYITANMCTKTNSYTRAYYEESIKPKDAEFQKIFFDANNLKKVNDAYGHIAGDTYLSNIANVISSFLTSEDYLVRWSRGDEFVLFLAKSRNPFQLKLDLDRAFKEAGLSVAAGIGSTIEEADRCMYKDKRIKKGFEEIEESLRLRYSECDNLLLNSDAQHNPQNSLFNVPSILEEVSSSKENTGLTYMNISESIVH